MKETLKKHWEGKFSLGQSYWIGAILIPIGLSIPLVFIGANIDNLSDGGAILAIAYWAFLFFANMFLLIGAFKSAANYVAQNKKKKKSTLWGVLAQILLALGMFGVVGQYLVTLAG
tara:strand:- start:94 stop:441 length:348 start_codon:yes stop_codon:yes gene_type:complete